jgi:hypothetical protein
MRLRYDWVLRSRNPFSPMHNRERRTCTLEAIVTSYPTPVPGLAAAGRRSADAASRRWTEYHREVHSDEQRLDQSDTHSAGQQREAIGLEGDDKTGACQRHPERSHHMDNE